MVEKIYLNLTCTQKDYIYYSWADNRYFLVFFLPPCSFLVPLTLANRFFFSFCCFLEFFVGLTITLCRANLYFGSNFLAKSNVSQITANPVDLPPPKLVLKPNGNTRSAVHLYIFASFSRISFFSTDALFGCRTSTIICLL